MEQWEAKKAKYDWMCYIGAYIIPDKHNGYQKLQNEYIGTYIHTYCLCKYVFAPAEIFPDVG